MENHQLWNAAVPQGSILGPMLFSIFISDIIMCCKNSSIHLYADVLQIYLSRSTGLIEDFSFRLNDDIESIDKWSEDNKLLINIAKTRAIRLHHKATRMDIPSLNVNKTLFFQDPGSSSS